MGDDALDLTRVTSSSVSAPALRRIVEKVAASIAPLLRARRQRTEFAANATSASAVKATARAVISELQRGDVLVIPAQTLHRRARIRLLLDEQVLLIDVVDAPHQLREINEALAELRVALCADAYHVLDMEGPVPRAVTPHVLLWILASHRRVPGIELVTGQRRIGAVHQHIIGNDAVDRCHVVAVVVKSDPYVAAARAAPRFVELVRPQPIIVECALPLKRKARDDHVLMAEDLGFVELAVEIVQRVSADVRRWCAQPVAVENFAEPRGRHSEIIHRAKELDILVSDRRDIRERPLEVVPGISPKTVEL